jgi:hypothetical protein
VKPFFLKSCGYKRNDHPQSCHDHDSQNAHWRVQDLRPPGLEGEAESESSCSLVVTRNESHVSQGGDQEPEYPTCLFVRSTVPLESTSIVAGLEAATLAWNDHSDAGDLRQQLLAILIRLDEICSCCVPEYLGILAADENR